MKNAPISCSASGDNVVVASPGPGRSIRVLGYVLVAGGSVIVTWKRGSTPLSGGMSLIAGGPVSAPIAPVMAGGIPAQFETAAGEALVLHLASAVAVGGHILYEIR
ncbi:hypothetical protein [Tuwongella immobilis]|uniref:Uncharacterized protein n=1 Tax=Tuwongella immobilis TaxID=692036 RepID=A0A6C2YP49_9BACT|nr:hypothetical protein [Tuwongella immobilis]VIP03071.1 unnamed protein product [Tuwongella immobilis]VTS03300.1 unnamed protein product [Tuwongella immobilis]